MSDRRLVTAIIRGRVQGVSYRAWTKSAADKLGLRGSVRNLSDGSVEAVFCGDADLVERMLILCRKGPLLARVDEVATTEGGTEPVGTGFVIEPA